MNRGRFKIGRRGASRLYKLICMILIPQRLFGAKGVQTLMRDGNVCILRKQLKEPVVQREGYISNHVISIVISGEQRIRTYDDNVLQVRAGELLFIPRGVYYITDLLPKGGSFESLLFYFDDPLIQEFLSTTSIAEVERDTAPDHLKFGQVPIVKLFMESFLQVYQLNVPKDRRLLQLKVLELLHLLSALASEHDFANFLFRLTLPQKRNIKAFMQHNYDKPLKVEDYAYLTGRSLSTFRRDFKAYFDTTPQQWLKDQRLDKALQLLAEREMSVTDLAYAVGYENISYFIKAFKQKAGLSPKQYMLGLHRNRIQS